LPASLSNIRKRVEEPRRFDSRGYSKEAVLRPHQKLLTKIFVIAAEINIDPQGIFRRESGNLLDNPADAIRRKEIKKKMRDDPVVLPGR
jgi:hypothetical protein